MIRTIIRLLKNPRVRQILLWVGPIIIGWIVERSKKSGTSGSIKSVKSKRYR